MKEVPLYIVTPAPRRNPRRAPRYAARLVREEASAFVPAKQISTAHDIYRYFVDDFTEAGVDAFYVFYMDQKLAIIGMTMLGPDSLSRSTHAKEALREVFRTAIALNSVGLIYVRFLMNRGVDPTHLDRNIVEDRLLPASKTMGIALRDYIIMTNSREHGAFYYSFQEHGLLF